MPTSRLGSAGAGRPSSASDRAVGPIFAAQPQVRARPVNVRFLNICMTFLLIKYLYRFAITYKLTLYQPHGVVVKTKVAVRDEMPILEGEKVEKMPA